MRAAQLAVMVKSCGLLLVAVAVEVVAAASDCVTCAVSEADVCVTVTMNLIFCARDDDLGNFAMSLVIFGRELEHLGMTVGKRRPATSIRQSLCGIRSHADNAVIPV